jgi:hypothetical protein
MTPHPRQRIDVSVGESGRPQLTFVSSSVVKLTSSFGLWNGR